MPRVAVRAHSLGISGLLFVGLQLFPGKQNELIPKKAGLAGSFGGLQRRPQ
jgi:hypothetical protein